MGCGDPHRARDRSELRLRHTRSGKGIGMNAKNVFQLQLLSAKLRHAQQWQLSTGHAGLTDLSGVRYVAGRPAHSI